MLPDLVVARYDEDISWVDELSARCRPVVYDKGVPDRRRPGVGLPNVGREAHTYLTHIVNNYHDRLADWTVFVQGDPRPHLRGSGVKVADLLAAAAPDTFACAWAVTCADWDAKGRLDWQRFDSPEARAALAGKMRRATSSFPRWALNVVGHDVSRQGTVTYAPGACFGVSGDLVVSRPKSFYEGLLSWLDDHPLPEEAHYLERLWAYVFGGRLVTLSKTAEAEARKLTVDVGKYGVVYCAHPSYGPGVPASHEAFWAHDVHPHSPYAGVELTKDTAGSSLLADAFNHHWKRALNLQLAGVPVSRFVMLHDDIVPEPDWLAKILVELDRTGADLVSAVVPLKDTRGLTSTALDDPDDPWEVYRRLSIKEALKLPTTFSRTDCAVAGLSGSYDKEDYERLGIPDDGKVRAPCRALLPNTGLWAARMDRPWRWKVHFEIKSRIAFRLGEDWSGNPEGRPNVRLHYKSGCVIPNADYVPGMKGEFINQVMSEDWDFGRQLAALGCDVRCTNAVKLVHVNSGVPFSNRDTGGEWDTDQALAKKWDKDPYEDVRGWLTPHEGRFLRELARGHDVLEIGSYCGKSTLWMAETARGVMAVDPFDGRGTPNPQDTFQEFDKNLERFGAQGKVSVFVGTSAELTKRYQRLPGGNFDIAFIDGAHDYESVKEDIRVALLFLKPDRVICFHDYGSHEGVTRAVDELANRYGFKLLKTNGSMALVHVLPPDN